MGAAASLASKNFHVDEEQIRNARLQQDLLNFVTQLESSGVKKKILESGSLTNDGLAGTWIESFYHSELVITVTEFGNEPATLPNGSAIDRAKFAASISGSYKNGEGSIRGLLSITRKSAQGIWQEGENEGLFQFDVVEDGLVFCGPYFHQGNHMGTWWGRNAVILDLEEGEKKKAQESRKNDNIIDDIDGSTATAKLQRDMLAREALAKKEQKEAAAVKKKALRDRVARRKQESGKIIPTPVQNINRERVILVEAMVEDLLFDPNLEEKEILSRMQASIDKNLDILGKIFDLGADPNDTDTMSRSNLWNKICAKVEALSVDQDDVDIMLNKVFGIEDAEDDHGIDSASSDNMLSFSHFVHFLFHLSNAFTLMHHGMLGSDHALDKLLPALTSVLL